MDLISVIVPIYKAEKYLERCVASVAAQTYEMLEIILVDDGSPDRSPAICDDLAERDGRIQVIHQPNSGVSAARNAGLSKASGRYIMMIDSDDYMAPRMIETMYAALVESESDLSICRFLKGNDGNCLFPEADVSSYEVIDPKTALMRIYADSESALQYVVPWAKLYKRELFENISYPEGKIFEDIYITHQILYRCHSIAVVPYPLIYYFQHADSIMNKPFHVGKLDYLEALNNRVVFFREHGLSDLTEIAYDEYLHSLIWEYSRARDLLENRPAMLDIVARFRAAYKKGYSSKRYPKETARYLSAFNRNPEWIIRYWKLQSLFKK